MYYITDTTQRSSVYSALASRTREFKQRLSFGEWQVSGTSRSFAADITYEKGIIKLDISQQGNSDGSGLVMGCCCSSSCTAEFYNLDKTYNYHEKIMFVECGIKLSDDSFFYIPCGYYKVDKPETDDDWRTVKVTAYDDVDRMCNKWNSALAYPSTAYLLLKEITDKYGIELELDSEVSAVLINRTVTEAEALTLTSYTEREVCGFIAGLAGANARMNTAGKMYVGWFSATPADDFTVPAKLQWQNGFKKTSESPFVINAITSGIDDAVFTAGTGTGITFANPIITEAEITAIYEKCGGMSFQPCTCEWRGNPCYECGDTVYVTDKNGVSYTVYIANQDIDLTGGLSMSATCPSGDAEISFDTVDERTRAALNRQYTALQQAIINATNAINGAVGGYYEILDSDNDGNPDGWNIKETEDGSSGIIRANKAGIALSKNGGVTYRTAITYDGINADCINTGKVKAEFIETDNLLVGMGNVDGLSKKLDSIDKSVLGLENGASSLGETQQEIINICLTEDMTYINGGNIATGSILADSIAANAITADKLSVGLSRRENLFCNPEFTENIEYDSTTYALGWKVKNATLTPHNDYVTLKPNSSTSYAGIYQKVWLKPGVYSIVARVNIYNASAASTAAKIVYVNPSDSSSVSWDVTAQNVGVSWVGKNEEIVVKYVITYSGEEGYADMGLAFYGFSFSSGYINIAWMALFEADEEETSANFYCSNSEWIKSSYQKRNVLNYSASINSYIHEISPFNVDNNGYLDVINGNLGCLEFGRLGLSIKSYVSDAALETIMHDDGYSDFTYETKASLEISKPTGANILSGTDSDSIVDLSKTTAPSIDITDDGTLQSFMGIYGYYCCNSSYSSTIRPQQIKTTGSMEAISFNNTSREKHKKDIKAKSSVLNKLKNSRIYEYAYVQDDNTAKQKTGFIIERETPEDVISDDGNGINLYSMASMNWKATQEILERLEMVEKAVKNYA